MREITVRSLMEVHIHKEFGMNAALTAYIKTVRTYCKRVYMSSEGN